MNELKPFDKVLVRFDDKDYWRASIYSHYNKETKLHICAGSFWRRCIPYEGNKELLGTTSAPNTFSKIENDKTFTISIPEDCIATWNMNTNCLEFIKTKQQRWRAKYGEFYWYILSSGELYKLKETNSLLDNKYYKIGNYFQTKEEAQAMADKFKTILKEE